MPKSERQIEIYEGDGYTVVYNQLIQDCRLRLQTRAVLILMLSKPEGWDFTIRGMAAIAGVTKDTMSKMFAELAHAGYLRKKEQTHESNGTFGKAGYIISGRPIFLEETDEPDSEFPEEPCHNLSYPVSSYTNNSPQENKEQENKEQEPPKKSPQGERCAKTSAPRHAPEWFETFYQDYPRKCNRAAAVRAWDKLKPDSRLFGIILDALEQQKRSEQWQRGYIPHPSTWLNQARWEDEIKPTGREDPQALSRGDLPEW